MGNSRVSLSEYLLLPVICDRVNKGYWSPLIFSIFLVWAGSTYSIVLISIHVFYLFFLVLHPARGWAWVSNCSFWLGGARHAPHSACCPVLHNPGGRVADQMQWQLLCFLPDSWEWGKEPRLECTGGKENAWKSVCERTESRVLGQISCMWRLNFINKFKIFVREDHC